MFVLEDTKLVDYQCQPLDVTCHLVEGQANWLSQLLGWLAEHILDVSITDSNALDAAFDSAGVWLGISVMVMVGTSIVGLAFGAIMQRSDLVKRAFIGTLLSFPSTIFAFRAVYEVLKITDAISYGFLNNLTGAEGISAVVGQVMETRLNPIYSSSGLHVQSGVAQGILLLLLFTIAMLFIAVAFAFRDFIVLLLIAFAPLAFVLLPAAGGSVWVKRWAGAIVAAILTKPLMLGALSLISLGLSQASYTDGQTFAWIVGALLVSFMPIMAFGFFNFITSDNTSGVASTGAGKLSQVSTRVTSGVKRLVSRPAMVAAPPVAAAASVAAAGTAAKNAIGQGVSKPQATGGGVRGAVTPGAGNSNGGGAPVSASTPAALAGTSPAFSAPPSTPPVGVPPQSPTVPKPQTNGNTQTSKTPPAARSGGV